MVTGLNLFTSAAVERGDRALRDYRQLLATGTREEIWADEMKRGAAVRWDILKRRAIDPLKVRILGTGTYDL